VAGLLAGAAIAVLYGSFDFVRGEPFETLVFLADGLLGTNTGDPTLVQVLLFTALHFLVFVALGIFACILTDLTQVPRTVLVGALFGLFTYSLVFYPALIVSGVEIVAAPAWPIVFFGNIAAGIVAILSLRRAREDGGAPSSKMGTIVREGIVAGLIGAGVVAVWFFLLDLVGGRLLFTPAALGSAMLYGVAAADGVIISAGTVLGYTLYHVAAFALVGIIASALLTQAEEFPPLLFGLFILFVVFETFVIFLAALLGSWLMQELAWWAIVVGNLLAAIAMGLYLRSRHPELGAKLRAATEGNGIRPSVAKPSTPSESTR
jgi:hypothetical protein